MSSPIGHSLAGLIISSWREKSFKPGNFKILALYVFIANAPDLDFIPGMIMGKPNLYHHGISHSIGAAVFFSLILAILINRISEKRFWREFVFMFSLYGSHLFLDLISYDGRPPFGIPVFWPFTERYFMIPILPPVKHSHLDNASIPQFLADVLSVHNLYVISLEMMLTVPFALILILIFRKRQYKTAGK
ncbi:MAG: metal-dependent hydrolase [Thermodesulfobacteriota bacterium]|nr:metal-dependent hydrolase [Thermodesulfobacteriota bacterium]